MNDPLSSVFELSPYNCGMGFAKICFNIGTIKIVDDHSVDPYAEGGEGYVAGC